MKKILLLLLILVLVVGCTEQFKKGGTPLSDNGPEEIEESPTQEVKSNWQDIPLKDVATQKTFKISDFRGKPVLLESFAVWCPTCTKQQKNIKELHKIVGDDVVSISLDTDPNEDADYVNKHITENGFDWLYAISPKELATGLIDEFGINVCRWFNTFSWKRIKICK